MRRNHLLQQWHSLSDPAREEALIEVLTMRRFAGVDLISDRLPDKTTILTFRHLLDKHDLGQRSLRRSRPTSAHVAWRCDSQRSWMPY
jgi:IS5 family transposase